MTDGSARTLSSGLRRKTGVDIVVGLDFGTSATKVAYRELGGASRRVVPLTFDHGLESYPEFCLPSVGYVTEDRRLLWGREAVRRLDVQPWSVGIRRLKVLVAGGQDPEYHDPRAYEAYCRHLESRGMTPEECSPPHLCAVAIAKQMHMIREQLRRTYAGSELDIRFNVCVPIDHVERRDLLRIYHRINHVAEQLYHEWLPDGWDEADLLAVAASKYEDASGEPRSDGRLFVIPEALAEVAAYLISLEARPGIHAVIDIGSGTTDLSIFNLVGGASEDRVCYWYAARNVPKGTGFVEASVAEAISSSLSPSEVLTETALARHIQGATGSTVVGKRIVEGLEAIWHALIPGWVKAARDHMKKPSRWDGIPVFLCGGGARLLRAREIFSRAWAPSAVRDFAVSELSVPDQFVTGLAPFDRLSVAYGLTFLGPEFGEFRLPGDSPDHTPAIRYRETLSPVTDGEPG